MTKYIDRYYLNGELYGIKFAEPGWQPGANTIAWYKFETDTKDYSGNNRDATNNGVTFADGYGIFSTSNNTSSQGPYASYGSGLTGYKTISCWFYKTHEPNGMLITLDSSGNISNGYLQLRTQNPNGFSISASGGGSFNSNLTNGNYQVQFNTRHLFTLTQDVASDSGAGSGSLKVYLDANYYGTIAHYLNRPIYRIGSGKESNNSYYYNFPGKFSNFILESAEWSAQEISDYYNQTKSLYGIS